MKLLKYILTFCFVASGFILNAQYYSFGQHVKYADECYQNGYYLLAAKHYNEAASMKGKLQKQSIYQYADAAYRINDLARAELLFLEYLEDDKIDNGAEVLLQLIEIRQMQERYEEAILDCNIYMSEYEGIDSFMTEKVAFIRESCQWVLQEERESIVDSVVNMKEINTAFSEQAPFLFGDSLYYNAVMKEFFLDKQKTYISRIYKSNIEIQLEGVAKDKFISHPSFTPDGKYAFYTVGEYAPDNSIRCDIYFSFMEEDSTFGVSRMLPSTINSNAFSSTHPVAIPQDTMLHLYFSSNRPGGKGGFDIWRAELNSDFSISKLENLESINTPYDEFAPFLDFNTNELYFSSNGIPGFGGFDIFRIDAELLEETRPENIGPIINSSYNDLFFRMNENGSKVYFTSNRPGSMYLDNSFESCCYDIYTAQVTECNLDLLALVYDRITEENLDSTDFLVIGSLSGDTIHQSFALDNLHEVELECDKSYTIFTSKEAYDTNTLEFKPSNFSYGRNNEIVRKIYLEPSIFDLNLSVFSKDTNLPLDSIDVILTNLQTGEEFVVNKYPDNNIHIDVIPDSDYSLQVARSGYRDTTELFNSGVDLREINKDIFLSEKEIIKQAKVSLANAIPVALYFDHDMPRPGEADSLAAMNYTETFDAFYDKRGKYIYRFVSQYRSSEQDNARRQASRFFDDEVRVGFDKYDVFKNQLLLVLESGQKINIYLRGYASPIALDEYNRSLGRRRVDSVRKEFDEWNDGAFLPYIQSGQLIVTERSFGEETSPKDVSDDPRKPYQSIYSPSASRERRVEIDEINFNEN